MTTCSCSSSTEPTSHDSAASEASIGFVAGAPKHHPEGCDLPCRLQREVAHAKEALADVYPAVSLFGGARVQPGSQPYEAARETARLLAERGISVITGGGPGIMEAGNLGCTEATAPAGGRRGVSIGLNIRLPREQCGNPYQDIPLLFNHFASRKVMFARNSVGFVAFAGGLGTLDEISEVLTLMQTNKMPRRPVVLVGRALWAPLVDWLRDSVAAQGLMSVSDFDLFQVVDTAGEVLTALALDTVPVALDTDVQKAVPVTG
jgi:uncharacterized protein (TIGR00730 family)